jgi:DNA-binding transcriptional ArsR family regulator
MSQKSKRGLQRGLSDIVEKQTAPVPDKSKESSSLIAKFRDQTPLQPPPTTSTSLQPTSKPISPARDYAKVANSITRDAIPAGLFKGTSKKLYDALYLRTRGAIVPVRQIKAKQGDLMQWAGVSHNTLRTHLRSLEAVGLIDIKWELGDNNGAAYEVRLPEEIDLLPPPTTSLQPPPSSSQNLGGPSNQKVVGGGGGQAIENISASPDPKTLIKTNTESDDDDAALAGLNEVLKKLTKEITGRELSISESDRWKELADVLAAELKIAAARTTVSSVPAFLAEHLRRRLWKIDKKQARAEGRELPDEAVSKAPTVDASKCPDCAGSGWWYPDGEAKGVAKCKHEKLTTES